MMKYVINIMWEEKIEKLDIKIEIPKTEDIRDINKLAKQVQKLHVNWRPDLYLDLEQVIQIDELEKKIELKQIYIAKFTFLFPSFSIINARKKINNPVISNKYLAYIIDLFNTIDTTIAPNITAKYIIIAYLAGFMSCLFFDFIFFIIKYITYTVIINPYIIATQLLIYIESSRLPVNWNANISINVLGNSHCTQNPAETWDIWVNNAIIHGMYKIICIIPWTKNVVKSFVNFLSFIAFFNKNMNNNTFIIPADINP